MSVACDESLSGHASTCIKAKHPQILNRTHARTRARMRSLTAYGTKLAGIYGSNPLALIHAESRYGRSDPIYFTNSIAQR